MNEKEMQQNKDQILDDLTELADVDAAVILRVAEHLAGKEYRRERYGSWFKDASYTGKNKAIYVCTVCEHWQSAKERDQKIFYMRYCPYCGARMKRPEAAQ